MTNTEPTGSNVFSFHEFGKDLAVALDIEKGRLALAFARQATWFNGSSQPGSEYAVCIGALPGGSALLIPEQMRTNDVLANVMQQLSGFEKAGFLGQLGKLTFVAKDDLREQMRELSPALINRHAWSEIGASDAEIGMLETTDIDLPTPSNAWSAVMNVLHVVRHDGMNAESRFLQLMNRRNDLVCQHLIDMGWQPREQAPNAPLVLHLRASDGSEVVERNTYILDTLAARDSVDGGLCAVYEVRKVDEEGEVSVIGWKPDNMTRGSAKEMAQVLNQVADRDCDAALESNDPALDSSDAHVEPGESIWVDAGKLAVKVERGEDGAVYVAIWPHEGVAAVDYPMAEATASEADIKKFYRLDDDGPSLSP